MKRENGRTSVIVRECSPHTLGRVIIDEPDRIARLLTRKQ